MAENPTKEITLWIEGREVKVPEGATVLDAARKAGVAVPTLCHHDDLTPSGHCRLCVVEWEGKGLVASCHQAATAGMRIRTETPLVTESRRTVLELLLADHPSDCLSCRKNGACRLQEVSGRIGVDPDRLAQLRALASARQNHVDRSNPFFDREDARCVLCGICVRTCEEIQGVGALAFGGSGRETRIIAGAGVELTESTCQSCGECVVRCPTGALVTKENRHATHEVKTTCVYCGVGCSIYVGARGGRVVSIRGDETSPVNEGVLCVKGRFGGDFLHSEKRLTTPLIRRNGRQSPLEPTSWDEALELVARKFQEHRGAAFAGISSSRATNEENYVVQKFVRAVMGTNNIDNCARLCHAPTVSGLSKAFGTGGGTNPLSDIDGTKCLLVVGSNTTEAHAVAGARIRRAARAGAKLIVADPRRIELCDHADLWLQLKPGSDVALLMGMAHILVAEKRVDTRFIEARCEGFPEFLEAVKKFDPATASRLTGVPAEKIRKAALLYADNGPALIVYSLGITEHTHGTDNVLAIANLALLTGNIGKPFAGVMPMRGQNNVQGACDMGCIPGAYPGSQPVTKPEVREKFERKWGVALSGDVGLSVVEMLQAAEKGEVKAFYIVGMDVAYSVADTHRTQAALRKAEFVVVQDILRCGTAEFADVVLPAAAFVEKEGTFTNLERRVQRVRKLIEPPGEAKPDWWIIRELARRLSVKGFEYGSAAEIMEEMASVTPAFAGFTFARLEEQGIQWPCPAPDHPGSPRLHVTAFNTPTGKGKLAALTYRPPAEEADAEYPIVLTTGRSLYHFHLAMTTAVPGLMQLHPEECAWIHPELAAKLQVADGQSVRVSSRRGSLVVPALVTDRVSPGTAFMTFHFYERPTNVLTQQALDPVSLTPEFKVTAVRIEKA